MAQQSQEQWVASALGIYNMTQYIYCENGVRIMATDGYRLHSCGTMRYRQGYYDKNMSKVSMGAISNCLADQVADKLYGEKYSVKNVTPQLQTIKQFYNDTAVDVYLITGLIHNGVRAEYYDAAVSIMKKPVVSLPVGERYMIIKDEKNRNLFAMIGLFMLEQTVAQ